MLGYSETPKKVRLRWEWMLWRFLTHAIRLKLILFCVSAKTGIRPIEETILQKIVSYRKPIQIIVTKTDRVSKS